MTDEKDTDFKKVNNLYALYIASMILQFFPYPIVVVFGFLLFLTVFIYTYVARGKVEEDSLLHNHATYLIRTIWLAGFLIIVTCIFGFTYLFMSFEPGVIDQMGEDMVFSDDLMATLDIYKERFFYELLVANIISFGPGIIYMGYRFANGLMRALKGYRVANVKSWL